MKDYVIVTDTCSDMFTSLRDKYNVDYIPMHMIYKGKEIPASLDWGEYYTERELWDEVETKNRMTTSQINEAEYVERFTKYIEAGKDILSISCSSALSQSINSSRLAKESLLKKYPDAKIYTIDGLNACKAQGLLTIKASELRAAGKTIEETAKWVEDNKLKVHQWCTVDDLGYLKRAGRVTGAAAFFGGILQVKPIIISDVKGHNASINKVKGRKAAIRALVDAAKEHIINPEEQTLYVSHGDCIEEAQEFARMLKEALNPKDIYIDWLGPIIGLTTGQGTLAVFFFGTEVTICQDE